MPNPYYTHASGLPATQTRAVSSQARAEFDSVVSGFDGVYAEILALAAAVGVPTTVSEVPVASSSTTDIGNGYGPVIQITGTNPITSFGAKYKGAIFIRFAGALVLTHSASLVCPGAANITTVAGDACIAIPIGNPGSGWRIAAYCRMSLGLVDDVAVRTSSTYADPAWLTSLAWGKITGLPTTLAGYGITDAPTKTGTGASGSWGIDITGSASKLGGVAAGTYLQNQTPTAFTSTGTAPAYTLTPDPAITALVAGKTRLNTTFHAGNGGAATTINVSGMGATGAKQYDSAGAKVDPTIVVSMNSDILYDGTHWVILDPISGGSLDTTRVDVASAATVNLTTSAPSTRHINITGTVGITGFTVAVGLTYFARFAGSLPLTNSASLVTQTGGNIVTQAGDTCILRATAANVVEVVSYGRVARLTLGTAQNTTSGTSIDYTGIPSWVNLITLMFVGVSTSGTAYHRVQLGTGGAPTTSGYGSVGTRVYTTVTATESSAGFDIPYDNAAFTSGGALTFTRVSGNTWACSGIVSSTTSTVMSIQVSGTVPLSGPLDMIRLTTSNGTDTFDAGSVNILYEG